MRGLHKLICCMAVGLTLAGCASLSGHAPSGEANEPAWQDRLARLSALGHWELHGRVGIVDGKEGGSGSLDWVQSGDALQFDFRGPLGAGALDIQGDSQALWVKSSHGDDFVTTDPETDFAERLHMPLPVLSMRYWMIGIPDPAASYNKRVDTRGELVSLSQRGWQVTYQRYAEVEGYLLPVQLTLQRDQTRIRVVVNQWDLKTAPTVAP